MCTHTHMHTHTHTRRVPAAQCWGYSPLLRAVQGVPGARPCRGGPVGREAEVSGIWAGEPGAKGIEGKITTYWGAFRSWEAIGPLGAREPLWREGGEGVRGWGCQRAVGKGQM